MLNVLKAIVITMAVGCAHSQQLLWQMFNAVEKGFVASGDTDTGFLEGLLPPFTLRFHFHSPSCFVQRYGRKEPKWIRSAYCWECSSDFPFNVALQYRVYISAHGDSFKVCYHIQIYINT